MKSGKTEKTHRFPKPYAVDLAKLELLSLYLADKEFAEQFEMVRQKHEGMLSRFIAAGCSQEVGARLSELSIDSRLLEKLEKDAPQVVSALRLSDVLDSLERAAPERNFDELLPSFFPPDCVAGLSKLAKDLRALATSFGLDYPWAVPRLLGQAITQTADASGLSGKHQPLIALCVASAMARSLKGEPLIIAIPPAFVLWYSEDGIVDLVRELLRAYKSKLKESGLSLETQDAVRRHMQWVFDRRRHRRSAKEIMDSFDSGDAEAPGYPYIADTIRAWQKRLAK